MDSITLAAVDEQLARCDRDPAVLVIRGSESTRLTALAVNWAMAHRDRFTGGVLYEAVDRYRMEEGTNSVRITALVAALLVSLGSRLRDIPQSRQDRVDLFRRRTASAPVLVVLDGADEPAQVRSVIPAAPGGLVIATTSRSLAGLTIDGAMYMDVDG